MGAAPSSVPGTLAIEDDMGGEYTNDPSDEAPAAVVRGGESTAITGIGSGGVGSFRLGR
jgi:hypothetical protein